jgi:hypothetical protein
MFSISADIWLPVLIGTIGFAGGLSFLAAGYEIGKLVERKAWQKQCIDALEKAKAGG